MTFEKTPVIPLELLQFRFNSNKKVINSFQINARFFFCRWARETTWAERVWWWWWWETKEEIAREKITGKAKFEAAD